MNSKILIKIISILLYAFYNFSDAGSQSTFTWEKLYGYPYSDDGAYDICLSGDGNYFVTGAAGDYLYILKLKQNGDTVWTRKYDIDGYGLGVVKTDDCGCAVTAGGYIIKFDCNGNELWRTSVGGKLFDLQKVSDGGFIAAGYRVFDGLFVKVDSAGNLIWSKEYTVSHLMGFSSCIEAIDGGYIAAGAVRNPSPTMIELLKVDGKGETIWERRFSIVNSTDNGLSTIKISGNNYIIFGAATSIFFGKVNLEGNLLSSHLLPDQGLESSNAANIINENKFVFTSQIFSQDQTEMFVNNMITDSSGNILFSKKFSTMGYMSFETILPLSNNDILFGGIFKQISGSNNDEVYIIRTDSSLYSHPLSINTDNYIIPKEYKLYQNYPNPFNPVTSIEFGISKSGFVTLKVYDILGKEVVTLVNENLSPGTYTVKFNGSNLASGAYFYRMESGEFKDIKRMVLIK